MADIWRTLGVSCVVRTSGSRASAGTTTSNTWKRLWRALTTRLAGTLDQNANSRAGEAATIVSNVLHAVAKR